MRRIVICLIVLSGLLLALPVLAQDPAQADPQHYKVVFENDQVRVLHIKYGPHEKGVMHEHPASLAIWLTDAQSTLASPDGTVQSFQAKAGDVEWDEATKHQGENTGDQPLELYQIEMKPAEMGMPMSGSLVCDQPLKQEVVSVEGRPDHSYSVVQTKCTWTKPWELGGVASVTGIGTGTNEIHGNWVHASGTFVDTLANGDKGYYSYEYKSSTTDGKVQISGHHWKLLGGTGTLKGARGKGTCQATAREDGKVDYECQGKYKLAD